MITLRFVFAGGDIIRVVIPGVNGIGWSAVLIDVCFLAVRVSSASDDGLSLLLAENYVVE